MCIFATWKQVWVTSFMLMPYSYLKKIDILITDTCLYTLLCTSLQLLQLKFWKTNVLIQKVTLQQTFVLVVDDNILCMVDAVFPLFLLVLKGSILHKWELRWPLQYTVSVLHIKSKVRFSPIGQDYWHIWKDRCGLMVFMIQLWLTGKTHLFRGIHYPGINIKNVFEFFI